MSLLNKTRIIIVSISLLLICLINAASRFILVDSFSHLEEEYSYKNIQRSSRAIASEKSNLLTMASDYAVWDDTYAFAENINPAYVNSNIMPGTFINLKINFFMILNKTGQIIASYGYDFIQHVPLTPPPDLADLISTSPPFQNFDISTNSADFVIVGGKPVLLAYHSILTSQSSGPAHGLLIIGRYLDEDFVARLSDITQLSIQIEPYENSELSRELQTANRLPDREPDVSIKILNPESIAGYTVLQDVFGNPIFILRTVMERDIYNNGYSTILFFIAVVFFGSLLFFLSAVYLLDKQVISRIAILSKSVMKVRLSGTLVDRIQVKGKDEISSLAAEINKMLQSLEVADYKLRQSRDELEKRVEDRTAELVQVNEYLKYEISERELGQKALIEAYDEINLIISSISSIMIGVNSDQKVTQWNSVAARKFGLSFLDVNGKDFYSLPIHWDWERISRDVAECLQNNKKVRMDDITLEIPGDQKRILGITLTPLLLKDKDLPGFLLIGSDITDRRVMEQQLGRSSKLEAIGQLAAGVAHEINTPTQLVGSNLRFLGQQLTPVLELFDKVDSLTQAIKTGKTTPEMALEFKKAAAAAHLEYFRQEAPMAIEQSLEGTERISHIVSAMRFFTHPGSENKVMANLNHIIQNALSLSRNEWKNVVEIQTDLDADLPEVACLPSEISQVMLNLIINAVHAIQDASGEAPDSKGLVIITTHQFDKSVEVRISDNGTGIPEEIRSKIFDPFFTTKDVGRGTGQGLAIAYTVIVKKHAGTLEFESELGRGTTFIIRLPRNANDD